MNKGGIKPKDCERLSAIISKIDNEEIEAYDGCVELYTILKRLLFKKQK